jgi:hypothetical protein
VRRILILALLTVLSVSSLALTACGSREPSKNKDFDRPTTQKK